MTRLLMFGLLLSAAAYTLIMLWLIWFTIAFFGFDASYADPLAAIVLTTTVLSPIPVWMYCIQRVSALRRGERPRL